MNGTELCVCVFTRLPVPGQVKTRLIPAIGAARAAEVHRQLLIRTLQTVTAAACSARVLCSTPALNPAALEALGIGGEWQVRTQTEGDLGARLARTTADLLEHHRHVVVIGSDVPELTAGDLDEAGRQLERADVVVGPCEDGGYYLIGLSRPCPQLFSDIPWGSDAVLQQTLARIDRSKLTAVMLAERWDVDRPADLARWQVYET